MPTVNERLQSATISHQVDLQHYSNAEVAKIIALLNRADADLAVQLAAALERLGPDRFTVEYLETVLFSVRSLNRQAYAELGRQLTGDLESLIDYELGYQQQLFTTTIPAPVLSEVPLVGVTLSQVRAAAFSRPFQGRLLSEWLTDVEAGRAALIRDAIRIGVVEGQTNDQIVRRIMGLRSEGYADGLLNRSRHDIESMVRTAIGHVSQGARDAFYQANDDLVAEVGWLSTLDGKTSNPCRIRDQLSYTNVDHKPIGHSVPWLAGPGRLHWQCRSTSTPIIKAWEELGLSIEEIGEGTRASMDGQVPESTTYGQWLKDQPAARQDEVLGPTRGKLFREGGLTMDRFYNQKGKFLTLDELQDRDARAFEKAGIAA
jgi:hypothetical protein